MSSLTTRPLIKAKNHVDERDYVKPPSDQDTTTHPLIKARAQVDTQPDRTSLKPKPVFLGLTNATLPSAQPPDSPTQPLAEPEVNVEQLVANAIAAYVQPLQATQTRLEAELLAAQQSLAVERTEKTALEKIFSVLGQPNPLQMPMVNTLISSKHDVVDGLAKDFIDILATAESKTFVDPRTGKRSVSRDMTEARRLFHSDRANLRLSMEKLAKANGFLRSFVETLAPTVKANIAPALLDYLSMVMRETHSARYVFWQFPFYKTELGKGPGDVIQVSRLRWIAEAATVADRTLTPGTTLSTTRQNITIAAVPVTLLERGLGKSGGTTDPVAIPEFTSAYSMVNLENAVNKVLGHDYQAWVDLSIRSRFDATTRVVYNNGGLVTTVPADVVAGRVGTLTEQFLNSLYAYMQGLLIPTDTMGNYFLVVPPIPMSNLKNSLISANRVVTLLSLAELTSLFTSITDMDVTTVSGYMGTFAGFNIFASNAFSTGAPGTEGVQAETIGVTASTTTRSSYAFGVMTCARGIGMDAEIRTSNDDDFQRLDSFVWISHETTGDLDIDPAIVAEQQLRVIDVRTIDVAK
jgi:hypothetical protein